MNVYGTPLDATGNVGAVAIARPLTMLREKGALAFAPLESLTVIVIGNIPAWEGVPLSIPLEDKVSPAGSAPLMDHEYGGAPPAAAND